MATPKYAKILLFRSFLNKNAYSKSAYSSPLIKNLVHN